MGAKELWRGGRAGSRVGSTRPGGVVVLAGPRGVGRAGLGRRGRGGGW